ncbi:MAG: hypothetical protein ACOCVC_04220 [Spirochaeta sp.]
MATKTKRPNINVPIKMIFTDAGVSYFISHNKRINKYRLSDNMEEYGIYLVDFSPSTVQRMMLLGYLSKIEVGLPDVVQKRKDIIDFTKLISYAMLYRQFDTAVFEDLVESDLVRQWNRHNMRNPIDFKTPIKHEYLNKVLEKNRTVVQDVRTQILRPLYTNIRTNQGLLPDEKNIQAFLCEKYLNNMNPLTWFILTAYKDSDAYIDMVKKIQHKLNEYIRRAPIPEYLGLMLIELLITLTSDMQNNTNTYDTSDNNIYILWKFNQKRPISGDRAKLQINISNQRTEFEAMKNSINDRTNKNVAEKSLKDFYSESGDSAMGNLGLYYLSYLSDACKKVNIQFDSFVNRIPRLEQTVINITMIF